jgi:hypothetical protein
MMFHYSEQWRDPSMQKQLVDPASTYIGKTKIFHRSEEYKKKKKSGLYQTRVIGSCRGVAEIENYTNKWEDIHGSSNKYAYHYFDGGEGIWRTEYVELTLINIINV